MAAASSTQVPTVVTPRVSPASEKPSAFAWHLVGADGLDYGRLFSLSPFARGQNSPVQQTYTMYNERADCFTTYTHPLFNAGSLMANGRLSMSTLPDLATSVTVDNSWRQFKGYMLVFEDEGCSSQPFIDISRRATRFGQTGGGGSLAEVRSNFCLAYDSRVFKIVDDKKRRIVVHPKSYLYLNEYLYQFQQSQSKPRSKFASRVGVTAAAKCHR